MLAPALHIWLAVCKKCFKIQDLLLRCPASAVGLTNKFSDIRKDGSIYYMKMLH